jgi:glycine/D-amino acid oxidase-like deaminating enzyme
MLATPRVCVIGAGVVGLSCATRIRQAYGDTVKLSVIADDVMEQTTSFGSGGLWMPYEVDGNADEISEWAKYSFEHFSQLYNSKDAAKAGVQLLTDYELFEADSTYEIPKWKDVVLNFSELSAEDLKKLGLPARFVKGYSFGTYVVDQKYYLKFLTDNLQAAGVEFIQRKLGSIEELRAVPGKVESGFDYVVNCAGLGAAALVGDSEMFPVRGQVVRVRCAALS